MAVEVRVRLNRLPEITAALPSAGTFLVDKTLTDVEVRATDACPVDTGNLRNNRGRDQNRIHWRAHYAAYVNFGTRYMVARPFVTNAVNAVMPTAQEAADEIARRLGL
jgi:HK97 gp10 family phage protein